MQKLFGFMIQKHIVEIRKKTPNKETKRRDNIKK